MAINIDLAGAITATSLVIGSVATLIVALRDRKANDSNEKAISVTRINDTDHKVQRMEEQIDFLFDEVTKLRGEKEVLEKEVSRLRVELRTEKTDHAETKRRLEEALTELKEKTLRLEALEGAIK